MYVCTPYKVKANRSERKRDQDINIYKDTLMYGVTHDGCSMNRNRVESLSLSLSHPLLVTRFQRAIRTCYSPPHLFMPPNSLRHVTLPSRSFTLSLSLSLSILIGARTTTPLPTPQPQHRRPRPAAPAPLDLSLPFRLRPAASHPAGSRGWPHSSHSLGP